MSQHTPGPWTAQGIDAEGNIIIRAPHANHWPALVCPFNQVARGPEQEANARLIAQAPAMLVALRDLTPAEYGCASKKHVFITEPNCAHCQAAEQARALLRAVEGQS